MSFARALDSVLYIPLLRLPIRDPVPLFWLLPDFSGVNHFGSLQFLVAVMLVVLLSLIVLLSLALSAQGADVCNGHAEYCSRIWSNVSHVGSHDSAFVGDLPTENQHLSVTAQLQAGIRFLQGQTHKNLLGTLDVSNRHLYLRYLPYLFNIADVPHLVF